jgi:spore coat protein A
MQLVSRQKFKADVDEKNGKPTNIRLLGQPEAPTPDEQGWKDTWVMYPGEVTRVIANFDLEGLYAWHCHILSHEDHEMMRPYYVGEMNNNKSNSTASKIAGPALEKQIQLEAIPNPFSNNFTLRFTLPKTSTVIVNMYDSKGSLVKNIYSDKMSTGLNKIDVSGNNWVNGIYFCEIVINKQRIVRKMVLQK